MPRNTRSRTYIFTLNNWTVEEYAAIKAYSERNCKYAIIGKEVGEERGTPHLQGYWRFNHPRSFNKLTELFPRCRVEVANGGDKKNQVYCSKQGDFWETGQPSSETGAVEKRALLNQRIREESLVDLVTEGIIHISQVPLLKKAKILLELEKAPNDHNDVRGIWIWGAPGVGKSRFVRENENDLYLKSQNKWWDGYSGEPAVLLDDLDHGGKCLGHYMKIWADRYKCSGEVKGAICNLHYERFYVTSNYSPDDIWPDDLMMLTAIRRRFKVIHMTNVSDLMPLQDR